MYIKLTKNKQKQAFENNYIFATVIRERLAIIKKKPDTF